MLNTYFTYHSVSPLQYALFSKLRLSPTELEMRSEALIPSFGYIRAMSCRVLTLTSQPIAFYSRDKQAHPSQIVALEPVDFALLMHVTRADPRP